MKLMSLEPLMEALNNLSQKELPIKISYKISVAVKKLSIEYELFLSKRRELAEKYAKEKDDQGKAKIEENGTIKIDLTKRELFHREMKELLEVEIELPIKEIHLDELGDVEITPIDIAKLEPLITLGADSALDAK